MVRKIDEETCKELQERRKNERPADMEDDYDVTRHTIKRHANGHCKCGNYQRANLAEECRLINEMSEDMTIPEIVKWLQRELDKKVTDNDIKYHLYDNCRCSKEDQPVTELHEKFRRSRQVH